MTAITLQTQAERLENWDKEAYGRDFSMKYFCRLQDGACDLATDIMLQCSPDSDLFYADEIAANALKITIEQAAWLFSGSFTSKPFDDITPQDAAKAIRKLITLGKKTPAATID